ncbi:MAG: LVIVD repeat-containing protein [Candidatus Heimdallarchaeota archaeon]
MKKNKENDSFAVSSDQPITGGTFAAQAIDADNISSLYSWDENYGNPYCVYYADNRAYLGTDDALVIADVSVPNDPKLLATWDINNHIIYDVIVEGDLAYIAKSADGIYILNISDVNNIVEVDHYDPGGQARDLFKVGDNLFVANYHSGLTILDVSDPTNVNLNGVGYQNASASHYAIGVYVSGNYAYVCFNTWGVDVIDISTITSPTYVSNYLENGYANKIWVDGDY